MKRLKLKTYDDIFNKFYYLELRLFIAITLSLIMIVFDGKYNICLRFKDHLESSICLLHYLYDQPRCMFNYISTMVIGHRDLILENNALRKELFFKNSELLLIDQYKEENCKLHALLNSPLSNNTRRLITKIIFINNDLCNQQAIINQGMNNNVYIGQPLIADSGIVGQVITVNKFSSRILLVSDPAHALSVKLKRNNVRMILMGRGYHSELYAEYPGNPDICINDLLVTSGLDGCFPAGYPVARVSNIKINSEKDYTIIRAKPIVKLQDLYYAILIWE